VCVCVCVRARERERERERERRQWGGVSPTLCHELITRGHMCYKDVCVCPAYTWQFDQQLGAINRLGDSTLHHVFLIFWRRNYFFNFSTHYIKCE